MKNQVLILLGLSILCFNGCSSKEAFERPKPVEITYQYIKCVEPDKPKYVLIDSKCHIGSKENLEALIQNIILRKKYVNGLIRCVSCYTSQIKEEEECKQPE